MSGQVKKEDIKKTELQEECLEQVSGGKATGLNNKVTDRSNREKINKSGPEDHWFED